MTLVSALRSLRSSPLRRLALGAVLAFAALVPAAAAAVYPTPLPDFVHANDPHYGQPLHTPFGGDEDRPLLVVYARWDDVDYPAGIDGTAMAQRFFGTGFPSITFPSVGDYFRRLSFNDLFLFPAAETEGTMNDGVVQVTVPGTKADFFQLSEGARNKRLLELADPFVDFEAFDADGNGSLSNAELVVNVMEAAPETPMWQGCGIARGVASVSLDGTGFGGILVAMNNTATNLITVIHENAHVALGMKDLYGFQVGALDIAAATCGGPDTMLFAPNAWHKLHWGWITPTVVTQDGYHDVRRADTTGDAFILYDPDKGHDHYFIVENRTRTPGSYDQGSSGDGLVIWRVADNAFGVATGYDPIGLVRQNGGDGWAADAFPTLRTMTSPWLDGTASNLAVRAIGPRGDVMRAYFDVRGPGVLVDPYAIDLAGPVDVAASQSTAFSLPVTNTGEADDTFTFELAELPAGWTTSTSTQTLAAGAASSASLQVTPAPNAPLGIYTIAVRGTSTTDPAVTTSATFQVRVIDVTPPALTVSLSPDRLAPPNHKLEQIAATIAATDDYDPNVTVELVSVTSSEPDNGVGDGDTAGDIAGADLGTDDRSFELRAERSGSGAGRVYTVLYRATDASGNSADATATVRVPHSAAG